MANDTIVACDATIKQCNMKIEEFNSIKEDLVTLKNSLTSCETTISNFMPFLENIIINNEPIDEGAMEKITEDLANISADLDTISGQCDTLIEDYTTKRGNAETRKVELLQMLNNHGDSEFELNMEM